ncbi:MAG: hypothetical protein ACHQ50_05070 [Fimbriimonadales bacterium]
MTGAVRALGAGRWGVRVLEGRVVAVGCLLMALSTADAQQSPIKISTDFVGDWSSWGLSGNQNKFRQYATGPRGFYLGHFDLRLADDLRDDARFVLKAPGQDDYRLSGLLRLNGGTTKIMVVDARNRFFDPDPAIANQSERRVSEGFLWQKLSRDFAISFRTRLDDQKLSISEPSDTLVQTNRMTDVVARGSLWPNSIVDLSFADLRYDDHTGALPETSTQIFSAGMMQQFGDSFALSGSYSRSRIRQPNSPPDKVEEYTFAGNLLLDADSRLLLSYRNERLTMPTVLMAYDRSRQQAKARVIRRLGSGWNAQLGYSQLALERLTGDHAFVDVPRLHTLDIQVSGRFSRSARMTATLTRQNMQGGAEMQTLDPRALYWNGRWDGRLKLNASNERADAYLVFGWHQNRNSVRDVTIRHQGLTVGAEWNLKPELEFYSEISTDIWSGHTSDPLSPDLNSFFPDATTFTVGSNWTINERTWATANYTFFNSQNSNPINLPETSVWGSFFTGTLHYKAGKDCELGLTVAPWQFADHAAASRGYGAGIVRVEAKVKF